MGNAPGPLSCDWSALSQYWSFVPVFQAVTDQSACPLYGFVTASFAKSGASTANRPSGAGTTSAIGSDKTAPSRIPKNVWLQLAIYRTRTVSSDGRGYPITTPFN